MKAFCVLKRDKARNVLEGYYDFSFMQGYTSKLQEVRGFPTMSAARTRVEKEKPEYPNDTFEIWEITHHPA